MKRSLTSFIGACMVFVLVTGYKANAQDVTVSFQSFYDNLAPYGQWVSDPQYGDVWVPNQEGEFRPYGNRGHWVMTDYGNTWVSDEPWGWACYHYGRWTYEPYYGWVWIPGYDWAPAWVSWRYGGGYAGWAPLGPGDGGYSCPDSWWIFVDPQYMYRPDCYHYRVGPENNYTYIHQTTILTYSYEAPGTRVHYNYGPRPQEIEGVTHERVQVYSLGNASRPEAPVMSGQRLNIYRPTIDPNSRGEARPMNVIQASHPLGAPQPANNIVSNRPPAFREELQQRQTQQGGGNVTGQRGWNGSNQQPVNRPMQQPAPQQQRQEPAQQEQHQPTPPQQRQTQQQQPADQPHPQQQMQQPQQQQRQFQAPPRPQQQQPQGQPMQQRQQPMQQRQGGGQGGQHQAPQQQTGKQEGKR